MNFVEVRRMVSKEKDKSKYRRVDEKVHEIRSHDIIIFVQSIHCLNASEVNVAHHFSYHMPFSLFHIHVVILSSGSLSSKFNFFFFKPIFSLMVDEFATGIWLSHEPRMWQSFPDFFHAMKRSLLSLVPLSAWHNQTSGRIGVIHSVHCISQHGVIM